MLDTEKSFSGKILMGIEFFNVCEPRPLSPQDLRSPIWISPQIFDELNAVENEKNKNNLFEKKNSFISFHVNTSNTFISFQANQNFYLGVFSYIRGG